MWVAYNNIVGYKLKWQQYPVITAHIPSSERWLHADPTMITTSTNRNILQPTKAHEQRRESIIQKNLDETKHKKTGSTSSPSSKKKNRAPILSGLFRGDSSSSSLSAKSGRSQLVDLVVEDTQAEETERVRARKEGGAAWNEDEGRQYMSVSWDPSPSFRALTDCTFRRTYDDEHEGEVVREGFDPRQLKPSSSEVAVGDAEEEDGDEDSSRRRYEGLDDRHVWEGRQTD